MDKYSKIKVDKKVKPIHFLKRKPVELIIGNEYFVSFGNHNVSRCVLTEISELKDSNQITIDIPIKPRSKKGFIDTDGKISHIWTSRHSIFADEIGLTPEEAVINEVTF
jgi:hypothetical protein